MNGSLEVRVEGTTVLRLVATPPIAAKVLAGPDGPVVMLVGSAAGLLAGDGLRMHVDLAAGSRLTVRSTAATIAHPCSAGGSTSVEIDCRLGGGAHLSWLPEPLIVCAGCHHNGHARLMLAAGATATWLDALTLGRTGEAPGRLRQRLDVEHDGRPLLREGLRVDPDGCGWDGPAVLGSSRHVAGLHVLGRRLSGHVPGAMQLAGPGTTVRMVAARGDELARQVKAALPPFLGPVQDPTDPLLPPPSPGRPGEHAKEAVHV
jgi:urease accessory protein